MGPTAVIALPLMCAREPKEVHPIAQSEVEVFGMMGFQEKDRTVGPDGLWPSFYKDGVEVLTWKLSKPGSIYEREEVPSSGVNR